MFRFKDICIAISIALTSLPSIAEEFSDPEDEFGGFYGDEDFVSIATGTKKAISKAPSVASVITMEDIERMGVSDLDEVLEYVPGLHISRSPNSNTPVYTFRGIYNKFNPQVLVLVNGIPITNMFVGNRSQIWGGMPVHAISRIEIIRGPGSAIYGAEAFAGVINVITHSGGSSGQTNVGMSYGSFNTKNIWASYVGKIGAIDSAISIEQLESDGHSESIEADAQLFLDGIFGTNASLAPAGMDNHRDLIEFRSDFSVDNWRWRAGLQQQTIGLGAGLADALTSTNRESSKRWNTDLTYKNDAINDGNWSSDISISYFKTSQEIDGNLIIFPSGSNIGFGEFPNGIIGNPEVFEKHTRTSATFSYKGFSEHEPIIGLGYNISDLYKVKESKNFGLGPNGEILDGSEVVDVSDTPYVFTQEGDRKNKFVYVQDVWGVAKDWELTAGVRFDDYSDFGSTTNPRLALVWSTQHNLTTKFLYGQAFRAPSVAETRNINNPVALGNPDLKPEEIETLEVAFDYRPVDGVTAGLSFFTSQWTDIIQFVQDEGATSNTAQNVGKQDSHGLEIEIEWKLSESMKLEGNYAYQKSEDKLTSVGAPYVPQQQLFLRMDWRLSDEWLLHSRMNRVMDRERAVNDSRNNIDDYTLFDINLVWNMEDSGWKAGLAIKNLFNEDAREPTLNGNNLPYDLPLAGRSITVDLQYSF